MDIELARTFVEIVSTGSFIKAAERLHVAQTTVSARVLPGSRRRASRSGYAARRQRSSRLSEEPNPPSPFPAREGGA